MASVTAAVLEPVGRACVVLESVDVKARLRGLVSEVNVTQVYRNLEDENIEAVYTFPLPLDAVLLELTLELNGMTLSGLVQPKAKASEQYEGSIVDGDSAVLLEQAEPGVFTMNVGNLLPGERAVIRFRYGLLHRWQGDRLRLHLPTTIAQRYGNAETAGLAPHQAPAYSLNADHGFTLELCIEGELANADFECPSHPVAVVEEAGERRITLAGGIAVMDRDFVLALTAPEHSAVEALTAADGNAQLMLASFRPVFPADQEPVPRCIKLVVDCSGSMAGEAFAQASTALHEILSLLRPEDHFNLVAFGNDYHLLFNAPLPASDANVQLAAAYIRMLDATMGGTKLGQAMEAAYRCGNIDGLRSDVLLITDGAVWGRGPLLQAAKDSGHRVFSVGVGSAVSEALVRGLAEATGGACELVSPREEMAERIVRHFQRMDQPVATHARINWPGKLLRQVPERIAGVHEGDTLHVFGWLEDTSADDVELEMSFEDGSRVTQKAVIERQAGAPGVTADSLPRIAAARRLAGLDGTEALELAVEYQLVSEHTSCSLVLDREAAKKAQQVPGLRPVPQVMAAGGSGLGLTKGKSAFSVGWVDRLVSFDDASHFRELPSRRLMQLPTEGYEDLESPKVSPMTDPMYGGAAVIVRALNRRYPDSRGGSLDIKTLSELTWLGLEQPAARKLAELVSERYAERDVVVAFLKAFADSENELRLSRHLHRLIQMAAKEANCDEQLLEKAGAVVASLSP